MITNIDIIFILNENIGFTKERDNFFLKEKREGESYLEVRGNLFRNYHTIIFNGLWENYRVRTLEIIQ